MKYIYRILAFTFLYLYTLGCNDPKIPENNYQETEVKEYGFSWSPKEITPDSRADIYFKADEKSQLFGYDGDVYAHIGIVDGGEWISVPAKWDENIEKCKMKKVSANTWHISLSPSVVKWFGVKESQIIPQIGIVVRNTDGTKKGIDTDFFISVNDNRINSDDVVNESLPKGMKHGINISSDQSVTFVLYDKDSKGKHYDVAFVIGSFNNWQKNDQYKMKRDEKEGVWWLTLKNLDIKKEHLFQYYLSGFGKTVKIADPYSEKVVTQDDKYIPSGTYRNISQYPESTSGIVSSFTIQKDKYTWKYSDNFKAAEKENLIIYELLVRDFSDEGNIKTVTKNLDYISSLGVNAIELMPVQEFDGNDSWGYNPCFYFALDKAYGTNEDYKTFIDECHRRGIAVIFDVVYNHCTSNSPLAKLYWDNTKNRPSDNNPYLNVEAPHPYSVFEDFNHESRLTQDYIKRNLKYMLEEYKIDGFRFDLSKGFTQKKTTEANVGNYDKSRINILKSYSDAIKETKQNAYIILEHFADNDEEKELSSYGMMLWRNANFAFAQAAMGYSENSSFHHIDPISYSMPLHTWVGYMESHDEERVAFKQIKYGVDIVRESKTTSYDRLIASAAFLLLDRGPKMIWQFGELAYDISIDNNGRTGKKPSYINKRNEIERSRLYDAYCKIINFRKSNPEFFMSQTPFKWYVNANDWNELRSIKIQSGNKYLYVLGNFDTKQTKEEILPNANWTDLIDGSKYKTSVTIKPNSVRILYAK